MRNRFDLQLKQLNDDIIEMGNMIERAIEMGVYALIGHDTDKAKQTIDYDMDIDHMERDIEALCMKLLLQQQPVARDLRQISSALKMITDMERIGDQASDIAELSLQLGDVSDIDEISLIQKMANETMMMVVRGTEAYVTKDLEVAHNVIDNDDVVDDLFDQIKMALVKRIQENHVKSFEAADLLMVAKYFERIGDPLPASMWMRQRIKPCNEITGAIKERRERMMIKRMWYELNILALRKHVRPVSLFLLVHTLLWCDLTWLVCQIGCDILEIPKALYQMDILLITAYAGVFGGLIGGMIYLMHENLI